MQDTERLTIALPSAIAKRIREKVVSGAYGSPSDVINEALRGWMEREGRRDTLDDAVTRGIADAEAKRALDVEIVRAKMRERFAQ